jgi:hypothetical protein
MRRGGDEGCKVLILESPSDDIFTIHDAREDVIAEASVPIEHVRQDLFRPWLKR